MERTNLEPEYTCMTHPAPLWAWSGRHREHWTAEKMAAYKKVGGHFPKNLAYNFAPQSPPPVKRTPSKTPCNCSLHS